ncbi:MAG TPA: hypothetical protein VK619_07705 [Pyrinomonadaceae bacterium]|nr:hypothetical protein [Pyrinomonadaceae bacterium]
MNELHIDLFTEFLFIPSPSSLLSGGTDTVGAGSQKLFSVIVSIVESAAKD